MPSAATLTFVGKNFGHNGLPETTEFSARTTLRKNINDVGFSLSLTDATLKDEGKTLKDVIIAAERKLGGTCEIWCLGFKFSRVQLTRDFCV